MALTINHNLNSLASSSGTLTISNTGAIIIAKGTTAQRPGSPVQGSIRYNTDTGSLEVFDNTLTWQELNAGPVTAGDDGLAYAIVFGG